MYTYSDQIRRTSPISILDAFQEVMEVREFFFLLSNFTPFSVGTIDLEFMNKILYEWKNRTHRERERERENELDSLRTIREVEENFTLHWFCSIKPHKGLLTAHLT